MCMCVYLVQFVHNSLRSLGISNKSREEKHSFKTWYMVQQIKWNKERWGRGRK